MLENTKKLVNGKMLYLVNEALLRIACLRKIVVFS